MQRDLRSHGLLTYQHMRYYHYYINGPRTRQHADNIDIYIVDCKVSPLSLLPLHHLFMLFVSDISLANGKKTTKKNTFVLRALAFVYTGNELQNIKSSSDTGVWMGKSGRTTYRTESVIVLHQNC